MSYFEEAKRDMERLLRLVRESVAYCTSINFQPNLATAETHHWFRLDAVLHHRL